MREGVVDVKDQDTMIRRTLYALVNLNNAQGYAPIHIALMRMFTASYDSLRFSKKGSSCFRWCSRNLDDSNRDLTMWDLIDLIVEQGARVNAYEGFGQTVLSSAIANAKATRLDPVKKQQGLIIVEEFLKRGANVMDVNNEYMAVGSLPPVTPDASQASMLPLQSSMLPIQPASTMPYSKWDPSSVVAFQSTRKFAGAMTSSESEGEHGIIRLPTDLSSLVPDRDSQTSIDECHPLLQVPESYEDLRVILQNTLVLPHFTVADRGWTNKYYKHDVNYIESNWDYAEWVEQRGMCKSPKRI